MKIFKIGVAIYLFCIISSIVERIVFWMYYESNNETDEKWVTLYNITMIISIITEFAIIIHFYRMTTKNQKLNLRTKMNFINGKAGTFLIVFITICFMLESLNYHILIDLHYHFLDWIFDTILTKDELWQIIRYSSIA